MIMMNKMQWNCLKLKLYGYACKWLERARSCWIWLAWLYIAESGLKLLEMAGMAENG